MQDENQPPSAPQRLPFVLNMFHVDDGWCEVEIGVGQQRLQFTASVIRHPHPIHTLLHCLAGVDEMDRKQRVDGKGN